MGKIERMTITMPEEMADAVRAAVESGDYATSSEIVREALRDWTRERRNAALDMTALREAVRLGDESGPSIPAEEVFAELRAIVARRRAG